MSITEFLLARIAEDEERAEFVARQIEGNNWTPPSEPWMLSWHDEYDLLCIEPSRALADCEAKRRIVEEARNYSPELAEGDNGEWALDMAVRALASVYADHPDYRDEWKS